MYLTPREDSTYVIIPSLMSKGGLNCDLTVYGLKGMVRVRRVQLVKQFWEEEHMDPEFLLRG